jgi:hypothetical protein
MKKKQYIYPLVEVMAFRSDLMKMTGPASVPGQFGAPRRKTEVF